MEDFFEAQKPQGNNGGTVSEDAGFEEFWKHYPKKISKGDARKAWQQTARIRPPLSALLKALAHAKACEQWSREGGAFIPYPATWLRGERWEDVHEVDLTGKEGKPWDATAPGIEAKGRELGMEWDGRHEGQPESFRQFANRVRAAVSAQKVVNIRAA
jgi:hypothetical protein